MLEGLNEERAKTLAWRVAHTPGYSVLEVRRAWSAAVAWQVDAKDMHTDERLLLLDESKFDRHLAADRPTTAHQIAAHAAP